MDEILWLVFLQQVQIRVHPTLIVQWVVVIVQLKLFDICYKDPSKGIISACFPRLCGLLLTHSLKLNFFPEALCDRVNGR